MLVLLSPAFADADDVPHVRVHDARLRTVLKHGAARSETLRGLLSALEQSSALVFVDCNWDLPPALLGRSSLVSMVAGVRYVRVDMRCGIADVWLLPMLGHELQHAVEIGLSPDIVDEESMEAHYGDVGTESYRNGADRGFETVAARVVERMVRAELTGR
jgi:hypothetical protein